MSKVPTRIKDKNGKHTTVHKNAEKPVKNTRDISKVTTPVIIDSRNPVSDADAELRDRFRRGLKDYSFVTSSTTDPQRIKNAGEEAYALALSLDYWEKLVSTGVELPSIKSNFQVWLDRHINEKSVETEAHRAGYKLASYYLGASDIPNVQQVSSDR